jgi:hypothetical protein
VTQTNPKSWFLRTIIGLALTGHFAAAAGYWWLSPTGFPINSTRFWLNSVIPLLLVAVACAGLIGMHKGRWSAAAAVVLFFASAWCAGAIAGRLVFPISLRGIWVLALVIGGTGIMCFLWLVRGESLCDRSWLFSATAAAVVGWFAVWAQIPTPASTTPINADPPQMTSQGLRQSPQPIVQISPDYQFDSAAAELLLTAGDIRIQCRPLLDFDRISPDRFWSLFARGRKRLRSLSAKSKAGDVDLFGYSDDSVVAISQPTPDGLLRLAAFTPVDQDAFSHLNTYCYFEINGHERLSLSFSPCPDAEIDVLPADYPVGRPARLAYRDNGNRFVVVEANSGEKGPFRVLAAGPLGRGAPLTIVVRDEGQPVAEVMLEDWSKQLSTSLSPCAGWRLPMNAIEFRRLDDSLNAPVAIWITLAGTSVGRGWETVGHKAGVYRNALVFQNVETVE